MEASKETRLEPAIAIVRGSTKEQINTIPTDERIVRAYADVQRFDLRCVFEDPCTPAKKIPFFEREIVAKALAYCREHGIRHIILTNIDHAFRDVEDCREAIRILTYGENSEDLFTISRVGIKGTAIHIVENGIDSRDEQCLLILAIRATCAAEASRKRSERLKEAFTDMRKTGQRTGTVGYGWDAIGSTRTSKTGRAAVDLIPNWVEQAILRRIIRWNAEGVSDNAIARLLNAEAIPAKRGGKWFGATIASIRQHGRLAEEQQGRAEAAPKAEDKKPTQKVPAGPGPQETATPAYAQLHCPACSHILRLTLPLQGRLWNCPSVGRQADCIL